MIEDHPVVPVPPQIPELPQPLELSRTHVKGPKEKAARALQTWTFEVEASRKDVEVANRLWDEAQKAREENRWEIKLKEVESLEAHNAWVQNAWRHATEDPQPPQAQDPAQARFMILAFERVNIRLQTKRDRLLVQLQEKELELQASRQKERESRGRKQELR